MYLLCTIVTITVTKGINIMKQLLKKTQESFNKDYQLHIQWLRSFGEKGTRLDLSNTDCSHLDMSGLDLRCADLRYCNLTCTNLDDSDCSMSNMYHAVRHMTFMSNTKMNEVYY